MATQWNFPKLNNEIAIIIGSVIKFWWENERWKEIRMDRQKDIQENMGKANT